jgi:hypothetical protein
LHFGNNEGESERFGSVREFMPTRPGIRAFAITGAFDELHADAMRPHGFVRVPQFVLGISRLLRCFGWHCSLVAVSDNRNTTANSCTASFGWGK